MNSCALLGVAFVTVFTGSPLPQASDSSEEGPCDYLLKGYDLGASCDYDDDCIADHSYCRNQQVCQCRLGFVQAPDGLSCIATVAAKCQTNFDCMTLQYSTCVQEVCQCDKDFVPDATGKLCIARTKEIGGLCQLDNQCQASFGDQSHCYGGRCECMMSYHFLKGRCYLTKDLNDYCSNSNECYIGPEYSDVIQCIGQKCQCIQGYYIDNYRKCKRSAGNLSTASSHAILLLALLYIIFHFYTTIK